MSRPKQTLIKALKKELPQKTKLIVAVSGGKDSVALLHACNTLAPLLKLQLAVAHVDHGLRKSSKSDSQFVAKLAADSNLKFFSVRLKKNDKKKNIEDWGRQERYKFFKKTLQRSKFDWVLTAHTADDVAETFLMRLVSNKELNSIERRDNDRKVIRPMLSVSTDQVLVYIKQHKLRYVEDETNKDESFLRNKVRKRLIPLLAAQFDKRITETLSKRAGAVQEDLKGLSAMLNASILKISLNKFATKPWLRTVKRELKDMPDVLSWRLAEALFKPKLGFNLGRDKSKELLDVLRGKKQGIELPGGVNVRLYQSGLKFLCVFIILCSV